MRRAIAVALSAAWAISLVALFLQTLHKAARPQGSDLMAYLTAARALLAGQDPYVIQGHFYYMYPVPVAILVLPLTLLPWTLAVMVWFAVSAVALVWAAHVLADVAATHLGLLFPPGPGRRALGAALWFVLFDPIQSNLVNGQINFQLLLLCLLFLRAMLRGRDVRAALFLAGAVSIKITPALLLAFAAVRRRWGLVTVAVLATAFLGLSPLLLVGPALWRYYGTLFGYVLPLAAQGLFPAPHGVAFGLNAPITRLLGGWVSPLASRALGIALPLGALAGLELGSRRKRSSGLDIWIFAAYLLAILLATPFSEIHHLVYLLPAAALVSAVAVLRNDGHARLAAGGFVVFAALLWGGHLDRRGSFFFLAIVLLLALVSLVVLGRGGPALSPGGGQRENATRAAG